MEDGSKPSATPFMAPEMQEQLPFATNVACYFGY
jgi:hypothetical protein